MLTAHEQPSSSPFEQVPNESRLASTSVMSETATICRSSSMAAHKTGSVCASGSKIGMSSSIPPVTIRCCQSGHSSWPLAWQRGCSWRPNHRQLRGCTEGAQRAISVCLSVCLSVSLSLSLSLSLSTLLSLSALSADWCCSITVITVNKQGS